MSFTFNGVNCETLGMVVERYPSRPFPLRKQTVYQIPGRSGELIVDEDAFENVIQSYDVYVGGSMQANLTSIASWLLSPAGYCELTDSYDTTIKRQARFIGGVEFMNSLNKYGKATAQFSCKPQRFPATDVVYSGTLSATITLPSSNLMASYPLLEIITVSANTSFRVECGTLRIVVPSRGSAISKIIVDWEAQSVYNAFNGSVPSNTSVIGDWAKVGDGDTFRLVLESGAAPTYNLYPRQYSL